MSDTSPVQARASDQLDERDLDQASGGLIIVVSPQIVSPRDPASVGDPKYGLPLI